MIDVCFVLYYVFLHSLFRRELDSKLSTSSTPIINLRQPLEGSTVALKNCRSELSQLKELSKEGKGLTSEFEEKSESWIKSEMKLRQQIESNRQQQKTKEATIKKRLKRHKVSMRSSNSDKSISISGISSMITE